MEAEKGRREKGDRGGGILKHGSAGRSQPDTTFQHNKAGYDDPNDPDLLPLDLGIDCARVAKMYARWIDPLLQNGSNNFS